MRRAIVSKLLPDPKSPEELLGELFAHVQKARIFPDGKTFADMVPSREALAIRDEYDLGKDDPDFDLTEFVARHFYEFQTDGSADYQTNPNDTMAEHITELWDVLTRKANKDYGSLIALPKSYIVPGGRFQEQFYWDSYFVMLGLAADGRWDMIENMIGNFAYMIKRLGYIPTANRTYFLSRSQPPFFVHMVRLLANHSGDKIWLKYLPALLTEYRFWVKGYRRLDKEVSAVNRVVRMPGSEVLARYYDQRKAPRPESFREDVVTNAETEREIYLHLRAAAESGWDFSSRWLDDPDDLATIRTADIVAVDLNCLLYDLEIAIAETYGLLKSLPLQKKFQKKADKRRAAIDRYFWHHDDGFYYDYDFDRGQQTGRATLAAVFPLWSGVASDEQARRVAERLEQDFLVKGGLLTTLVDSGQQWDAPNGWAPLIWVAVQGLRNYGYNDLAEEIRKRWLAINEKVYRATGKMVEKYNVRDSDSLGGGGEYPLQDGFGWTNGVARAFLAEE
ncbi:alpha,alpha-trehalase TreF [Candidatus Saccharibacteria bacterium]|nr:alpha,alpha-trehalase TreF [Candidatus Saccharibacteria bacterium]